MFPLWFIFSCLYKCSRSLYILNSSILCVIVKAKQKRINRHQIKISEKILGRFPGKKKEILGKKAKKKTKQRPIAQYLLETTVNLSRTTSATDIMDTLSGECRDRP